MKRKPVIAGPWGDYRELVSLAEKGLAPSSIDGRRPVAIERKGQDAARLLYEHPEGRERVPDVAFLPNRPGERPRLCFPEYVYIED